MAQISQLILGETGCVSYIISSKKEAIVIDSFQGFESDIEKELERLQNPQIKYVMDTHTHADRKSASSYFSEKYNTGGIVKSNKTKYRGKIRGTNDGDILKIGASNLLVVFTPGHTHDHNCYLVDDKTLLSGDCLFIGDVGRIDLGGDLKEKSDLLFNSLRTLENLPKDTRVYPNHVGAAHAIDSEDTFSTIGNEMETNKAMQIKDNDEFYTYMTEGWPSKPDNWEQIIEDNLNG
tara:strand:- start:629 stop:1333 length:705 start_codon:yes stop_codon:yes gene_type:complete